MWKCKECGCEVTGLGGITYETCGLLDKKGNIKKHEILEEIDSDTDFIDVIAVEKNQKF